MPHRSSWVVTAGGLAALFIPAAHGHTFIESRRNLRNSPQVETNAGSYDAGEQIDVRNGARGLMYSDSSPSAPEPTPAPDSSDDPAPHGTTSSTEPTTDDTTDDEIETPEPSSDTTMEPATVEPVTPAPVGEEEMEEYEYLGCFHDNKGDRVLGDKTSSPDMTTKMCFDYCTDLGAALMATQWGFECWCSPDGELDYNRHYEKMGEDAACDMPCMGDETEICGGFDSFELYKLMPECSGTSVEVYEQCGGLDWTGSTCCADDLECVEMGDGGCYSQCRPASTGETTPSPTAAATGMDTSREAPTPSPVSMDRETAPPVTEEPVAPIPEPTHPPTSPEVPPTPAPVTAEPMTPATPTPGTGAPADMQNMLDLHNEARCIHNADPLTWSSEVEASAAKHAKVLSDACGGLFHSDREDRNGYGENIYYCGGYGGDCYSDESAMEGFYESEIQTNSVTGYGLHATQILWKSTKKLGCVTSECASAERVYLVCQYDPPGNMGGMFEQEVDLPTNAGNC